MRTGSALVMLLTAAATPAWAQGNAPKPATAPPAAAEEEEGPGRPPELDQLKAFVGTWRCVVTREEDGKKLTSPLTFKARWDLGESWLLGRFDGKKTRDTPFPFIANDHWTYDASAKQFYRMMNTMGGGWATGRSRGWQGDRFEWAGDSVYGGVTYPYRFTLTRTGPRALGYTLELKQRGAWKKEEDVSCKR